jgi:hypothetical protein
MVVDAGRELRIRARVVERWRQQHRVDGLGRRLDACGTGKVFSKGLPDQVAERHPPRPGRLRGAPVEVGRKQQLRPVHV